MQAVSGARGGLRGCSEAFSSPRSVMRHPSQIWITHEALIRRTCLKLTLHCQAVRRGIVLAEP